MAKSNSLSPNHFRLLLFISLVLSSSSIAGCDAGSGSLIFVFVLIISAAYLASKASKDNNKKPSRNMNAEVGSNFDESFDEAYDLNNGVELRITTTWGMQANAQAGKWVMSDVPLDFKGVVIPKPMFYMSKIAKDAYPDPALINPSLPVAKEVKGYVKDLGYWPSYSDMTPGQRRLFIEWLATGRKDPTIDIGYVFVFYYGLERRLLIDQQNIDEITNELRRLRRIYDNGSFLNYSSNLLTFNNAKNLDKIAEDDLFEEFPPDYGVSRYSEETLNTALSWHLVKNKPLSWRWALIAADNDPRSPTSVVTKRVKDQFEQLFKQRYQEKFGDGLMLRSAKRQKTLSYNPSSGSLATMSRSEGNTKKYFDFTLPNVLGITSQFKPLIEIWTQCINDLKAFSRQQAKVSGDEQLSAEAWEKLPPELQAQNDHPESGKWSEVIDKFMDNGTVAWLPVNELAALKEIPVRDKLTIGQSTKIADTAACLEYAIEPDARLVRRGYSWGDKLAVYHDPMPNEHLDAKSAFSAASVMLHLAISVAAADGNVDPKELKTITNFLDNQFNLSDSERKRLTACGNYLIGSKVTLAGIGKRIHSHLEDKERHQVGRFLVAVAAADGVFEKSEISALKKIYKLMGMDANDALKEIEIVKAASAEEEGPVIVQKGKPGKPGEEIPPKSLESESVEPVKLNPQAIAKIIDDTKNVSQMLGAVLAENEEDMPSEKPAKTANPSTQKLKKQNKSAAPRQKTASPKPQTSNPKTSDSKQKKPVHQKSKPKISIASLPPEYRPFIKSVIKKPKWTKSEFRALADKHKVMINGAIEAINEWSEDELGDFLIDDDNPYTIRRELLKG